MNQSDTRSLGQIRRETEQTRAALSTTVEELRGTVSETAADIKNRLRPDALKAEVSGYIKSRGEQLYHDMTEAARRNPMQAIAVGASVAYPVLRMARAIPLPILMIGAGLFLAGSKTGQDLTQKASDLAADASAEAGRRIDDLRDQASQIADRAAQAVTDVRDLAADAVDRTSEAISGTARQATVQANELADKTSRMADLSTNAAQQTVSQVTDAARDAQARASRLGRDLVDGTRERLSEAGDSLSQVGRKTANTISESIQNNPLLVAGVGLLVGGLIASVLPKSQTEQDLLGDASEAVKRRAQQAAAAGFESAKGATGEILANVAQQASAEGLTPVELARGAQNVTERVKRVAERAVTTAFDPDQHSENHQSEGTGGGRQNG
jgi:ElaB/YqjD/DUF883 family membrane-anchored ribosome-binding protein